MKIIFRKLIGDKDTIGRLKLRPTDYFKAGEPSIVFETNMEISTAISVVNMFEKTGAKFRGDLIYLNSEFEPEEVSPGSIQVPPQLRLYVNFVESKCISSQL